MLKTKIILPDGTELSSGISEKNAVLTATLTQKVNDQTELSPGSVCSSMLETTVLAPEGALRLDAGGEVTLYKDDTCMGLFTLEKPSCASANTLKLTAYDRVSWLDKDLSQWLAGLTEWPYPLFDLAKLVCEACGLELANTEIPNGSYLVQPFSASGITGRQLMQWIGQAAGRFCRATVDGRIEFAWYTDAPVSIGTTALSGSAEGAVAVLENVPKGAVLRPVSTIGAETDVLTLQRCRKNLFNDVAFYEANGFVLQEDGTWFGKNLSKTIFENTAGISGAFTISSYAKRTDGINSVVWTVKYTDGTQKWRTATTADGEFSAVTWTTDASKTVASIGWTYQNGGNYYVKDVQIEYGAAATGYEPYCGEAYTVQLPQSVSSGSFDWSTGILSAEETMRLDPVFVPALEGINVLYSNCGDTSVSYRQLGYYQNSLKYEDYRVAPIEKVQIHLTDTDVGAVYPDIAEENTYTVTGNYLLTSDTTENLMPLAQTLYEQLKDVTYTPCQVTVPAGLELSAGQVVTVTDRNGHSFQTYIMDRTMSAQRDTLKSTGSSSRDSTTAVNARRYEALSGRVMELSTKVEGLKAENRDAANNAAKLELAVEGIKAEVTRQEGDSNAMKQQLTALEQTAQQVQIGVKSIQDNGVSKVKTQTGFVFDDGGLHISKTGSDLENSVTEKGVYVVRNKGASNEVTMLQADAHGVIATDVSVRNYLIVGNARFEEYTGGRTACFHYGG